MRNLYAYVLAVFVVSCSKPEQIQYTERTPITAEETEITLMINEYAPKGDLQNEEGIESDWIELYNPSNQAVQLDHTWSITDDRDEPEKFVFPDTVIQSKGYLLVWCDGSEGKEAKLHTPFKLSGNGETISLYQNGNLIDQVIYDQDVKRSVSYARIQDGSTEWQQADSASPGKSNNLSDNYAESLK